MMTIPAASGKAALLLASVLLFVVLLLLGSGVSNIVLEAEINEDSSSLQASAPGWDSPSLAAFPPPRGALGALRRALQPNVDCQPSTKVKSREACERQACPNLKWVKSKCGKKVVQGCLQGSWCKHGCKGQCKKDSMCKWSAKKKRCGAKPDPFKIEFAYPGSIPVPAEVRALLQKAANSWSKRIRRGMPSTVTIQKGERYCSIDITQDYEIHDLLILVFLEYRDGPGNVLALSGVCGIDNANYARLGAMYLDLDDLSSLIKSNQALDLLKHEIGHTLGIGTLWKRFEFIAESDGEIRYIQKHGVKGNKIIKGPGRGPIVEDETERGIAETHWKESIYSNELMTGVLDAKRMKMSAMTLGALKDLGYDVDMSTAAKFVTPRPFGANRKNQGDGSLRPAESDDVITLGDDSFGPNHEIKVIPMSHSKPKPNASN